MYFNKNIINLQHLNSISHLNLKVGIFGGTFNPPHKGHLYVSKNMLKQAGLDMIIWLVSPNDHGKEKVPDVNERIEQVQSLLGNSQNIFLSNIEAELQTSNTAEIMRVLKQRLRRAELYWIMGADNLERFHKWENYEEILQNSKILVYDRGSFGNKIYGYKSFVKYHHGHIQFLRGKKLDISSTMIRQINNKEFQ